LILSVAPAARNLKPWSWAAVNRVVRIAKVKILRNRCLFLHIGAVVPPHLEVLEAVQDVQAAPVQTAAAVIKFEEDDCYTPAERKSIKKLREFLS
jgi:hypothetical protein